MDDVSTQTVNLCPAEQWHLPQAVLETRMIATAMWEGGDRAQKEIRELINSLRRWLPFLSDRQDREEGSVDNSHPRAKQRMMAAIQAASVVDGVNVWRTRLLSSVSVIQFGGVATAAISCLSSQVSSTVVHIPFASRVHYVPSGKLLHMVHPALVANRSCNLFDMKQLLHKCSPSLLPNPLICH